MEAWAKANGITGLSYVETNQATGMNPVNITTISGDRSVLYARHNVCSFIYFDASLLSDAEYYTISFDWRATKFSHTTNKQGIFGITKDKETSYVGSVDRSNGDYYFGGYASAINSNEASKTETAGKGIAVNEWYTFTIIVDNRTGSAYVYVTTTEGLFVDAYEVSGFQITGEESNIAFRFGLVYNLFHLPEFDNFKVSVLDTFCEHEAGAAVCMEYLSCAKCGAAIGEFVEHDFNGRTTTVKATCLADGSVTKLCNREGCAGETTVLPQLDHEIADYTIISTTRATCTQPGTKTGLCINGCRSAQTIEVLGGHTTVNFGDISNLTIRDGKIWAECYVCKEFVEAVGDERLALNFDQATLAEELAAWAAANKIEGLAYREDAPQTGYNIVNITKNSGGRSVLYAQHNVRAFIDFDPSLLAGTDYYVISFDWRATKFSADQASSIQGILGLCKNGQTSYVGAVDRKNGNYYVSATAKESVSFVSATDATAVDKSMTPGEWYTFTIVVDNASGDAYVYVSSEAGMFVDVYTVSGFSITGTEKTISFRLGTQFNIFHQPEFDNFSVIALSTDCEHERTVAATCTDPETCYYCGFAMAPAYGHAPTGEIISGKAATCLKPGYMVEKCANGCDGIRTDIAPVAHNIPEANVVDRKDPTCSEAGYVIGVCDQGCKVKRTVVLPVVPHTTAKLGALNELILVGGEIQTVCCVCQQTVSVNDDVRLALDFSQKTLADEIAQKNAEDETLGLVIKHTQVTTDVPEGYIIKNGVLRGDATGTLMLGYNCSLLNGADYYMISFDWRFTNATTNGQMSLLSVYSGVQGSFGANLCKYDRTNKVFTDGASAVYYPTDGSKLVINQWYTITAVVDNEAGDAYVYINGVYVATVSSTYFTMVDGESYAWRFGEQSNGHRPEYDNFKVIALDTSCDHVAGAEATCEDDQTCIWCGEVLVGALGHDLTGKILERKSATCLEAGYYLEECANGCGGVKTELAILEHAISEENVIDFKNPTCVEEGYKKGLCVNGCGAEQTVILETVAHTTPNLGDLMNLAIVDGKIQTVCCVCKETVDMVEDLRLALDFDKATVEEEVEDLATEENGFLFKTNYNQGIIVTETTEDGRTVMRIMAKFPGGNNVQGQGELQFNGVLLDDAEYYMISFDYRASTIGVSGAGQRVFYVGPRNAAGTIRTPSAILSIDRTTGQFTNDNASIKYPIIADPSEWYTITYVVNNTNGYAYLYIDGVFCGKVENTWHKATSEFQGEGTLNWFFGYQYNTHNPLYDNFRVYKLDTSCNHVANAEATCEDNQVCIWCGEVLAEALGHLPTGEVIGDYTAADCSEVGYTVYGCERCDGIVEYKAVQHTPVALDDLSALTIVDGEVLVACASCGQSVVMPEEVRMQFDFEEATRDEFLAITDSTYGVEIGTYVSTEGRVFAMSTDGDRTVLRLKDNESVIIKFDENLLSDASYYMISFDWRWTLSNGSTGYQTSFAFAPKGQYSGNKMFFQSNRATGQLGMSGGTTITPTTLAVSEWATFNIVVNNETGAAYIYVDGVLYTYYKSGFAITEGVQAEGTKLGWFLGGQFNVNHQPEFDNFKVSVIG